MTSKGFTALALALLPSLLSAQASPIQPNCSAERRGDRVVTTVQYANGYLAEAPWRVAHIRAANTAQPSLIVTAVLDRVIEYNPATRERVATPFPSNVEIELEVPSPDEILPAVAKVWCSTVTRVRGADTPRPGAAPFLKVTAAPAQRIVA